MAILDLDKLQHTIQVWDPLEAGDKNLVPSSVLRLWFSVSFAGRAFKDTLSAL